MTQWGSMVHSLTLCCGLGTLSLAEGWAESVATAEARPDCEGSGLTECLGLLVPAVPADPALRAWAQESTCTAMHTSIHSRMAAPGASCEPLQRLRFELRDDLSSKLSSTCVCHAEGLLRFGNTSAQSACRHGLEWQAHMMRAPLLPPASTQPSGVSAMAVMGVPTPS